MNYGNLASMSFGAMLAFFICGIMTGDNGAYLAAAISGGNILVVMLHALATRGQ